MPLITCTNAAFGYEGTPAVSGLNFALDAGDYLCVVGENGAGKTTLLKGVLGLLRPLEGSFTAGEALRADEIGYLPQQTAAQKDFPASVEEVVRSGCLNRRGLRPYYNREEKRRAAENMDRLGIGPLGGQCYRALSGGQQQRVLLARALCAASRLLVLDEPVAGLDPVATRELYRFLSEFNRATDVAVLMVSHDVHSAVGWAGHILHLRQSQQFFGTAADYAASETGRRFLGRDAHA